MSALTAPSLIAAALLALAGAQKVIDPVMTVGALRSLGVPASPLAVRVGSAVELGVGATAIALGGAVAWGLVAISYVAFGAFVVAALRAGTMIGSCGCFGRDDTPPHPSHVLLNLALAGIGLIAAGSLDEAPVNAVIDDPGSGLLVVVLSGTALYLLHAAYVELPRTLAARRPREGATR